MSSMYFVLCMFQAMREGRKPKWRVQEKNKSHDFNRVACNPEDKTNRKKKKTQRGKEGGVVPYFSKYVPLNNSFLDANRYYDKTNKQQKQE